MSSPVPPETGGAYIYDASTFLKGLRSISLRNLSFRSGPAAAAVGSGIGSGRANGERDSASVTNASLRSLQAVLMMNDASASPAGASASEATDGVYGHHDPPVVAATTPIAGGGTWAVDGATTGAGGFCGRGKVLLTTEVSQPTVNPTWPVPEASWLHADAQVEDLDGTRLLLLRVFAVDPDSASARDPSPPRQSPAPPPAQASGHTAVDAAARARDGTATLGPVVWECTIDVKGLTALPVGSRLSHLWALPADCLLVEMSNGGLYAADWVVQALSSNSALPEAVAGGRTRGGGGGGGDAWRDDSDKEDDEDQEPLDEMLRRVLVLEAEAERGRVELAAQLEKAAPGDRKHCAAAESACAMDTLRLELSNQQELLEAEEASFLREKRYLEAETLAVEELLKGIAEAEEAAIEDGRQLESEQRETFKSHVLLEARRARLTAELQAIYPIKYQGSLKEFTIRGLELPADLYSIDDERISSALGYTAHLVCMLAKYLQISLRYQVIYNASRSAVRDNVTGVGVAYPLFRRGVEKERFDRGVYLLGRDVEQMLTARGVPAKRGSGQLLRNLERLMSIDGA
ncbi:unnamed protein product [Ectocarpus sp. CCAP 1310/34]|nr:unnamed protein product [Ectocarpus sp. CCAP 1310/34]